MTEVPKIARVINLDAYNEFAGKYNKEALIGRFDALQGTPVFQRIDQAINRIGLPEEVYKNIDYTEDQVIELVQLVGEVIRAEEEGNEAVAKKAAGEIAQKLDEW